METSWKVGEACAGELSNAPRIVGRSSRFEGVVTAVESAESSDVGEELVEVQYTKPAAWSKLHRETKGWHYASELEVK